MEQIARNPKQLGQIIRRQRQEAGLNQSAVGKKAALRQATISEIENGAGASITSISAILLALDLEMVIRPRQKYKSDDILDIF